jgi:hypothetical protein
MVRAAIEGGRMSQIDRRVDLIDVPLWRHYMLNSVTNSARVAEERTPVA